MESINNNTNGVRKLNQRQYQLVVLAIGTLFAIGLVLWGLGVFKSDTPRDRSATNAAGSLASVPKAKNKPLENEKYRLTAKNDPRFGKNENNLGVGYVVGSEPSDRQESNEYLTENDYTAVEKAGGEVSTKSAYRRKREMYQNSMVNQRAIQRENARMANPNYQLYRKSPEELREERALADEKEINQRTAKLILDRMEKNQTSPNSESAISTMRRKTDALEETNEQADILPKKEAERTELHPEVQKNTIGLPVNKTGFFYNVSMKNKTGYSANDAVCAVIHGYGSEGIKVQNGTVVKIRLVQNTIVRVKREPLLLEKGTIVNGRCTIGDERIFIEVTSVVFENAIYPLTVQAYDMDGQLGIHVPNLKDKNLVARNISRTAVSPINGGFFVGQGGIGQQVGTQMAVQGAQQVVQSAKQYVTARAQNPKVTIRPNYQILLKSTEFTPTTSNAPVYEEGN
jgi:hypothetical protein